MIQRLAHLGVGRDHLGELCGDRVLVEAGFGDVEVEPAFGLADRAAGDRIGQHGREQMQRGVHAHAGVADGPSRSRPCTVSPTLQTRRGRGAGTCAISVLPGSVKTTFAIGIGVAGAVVSTPRSAGWPPEAA